MSQGRKGRSPDQIRSDRALIARLYLEGHTQEEIGATLGLSRQQIGHELKAVRKEWQQSALMDFNARKAEELAQIGHTQREYWIAWQASKKGKETTTSEQTTGEDGEKVKASIRKTDQTGDPRYLAGVERCIDRRCKLLGLDAPQKIAPTTPDGEREYGAPLSDADRAAALANLYARLGVSGGGTIANGEAALH